MLTRSFITRLAHLDWFEWVKGVATALVGGGSSAVLTVVAGQISGAANFTLRQMGTLFVSGAIISLFMYLKQSPIPKELPDLPNGDILKLEHGSERE